MVPGAFGRIGIIQPTPGVMIEYEWPRWLPDEVLFPVMRVPLREASAEGYREVADLVPGAAKQLASAGATLVAYACTIGSLFAGAEAEDRLIAAMEQESGLPALSLGATSVKALRKVSNLRPAVLSPYSVETNRWLESYLLERGLTIAGFIPTPVNIVTVGNLPSAEISALAITGLAALPDATGLWIPCTAIRTLEAIRPIELASGLPAISGSQALLWHALKCLGLDHDVKGLGSLFAPDSIARL